MYGQEALFFCRTRQFLVCFQTSGASGWPGDWRAGELIPKPFVVLGETMETKFAAINERNFMVVGRKQRFLRMITMLNKKPWYYSFLGAHWNEEALGGEGRTQTVRFPKIIAAMPRCVS